MKMPFLNVVFFLLMISFFGVIVIYALAQSPSVRYDWTFGETKPIQSADNERTRYDWSFSKTQAVGGINDLNQIHYRWRNNDGSESTATFMTPEDTATTTVDLNTILRLRIEVSNEGTVSTSERYVLQFGTQPNPSNDSGWMTVPDANTCTSSPIKMVASSLTEGGATTNVSSGLTDENTTFVAGEQKEDNATTTHISLDTGEFTEMEWSLLLTENADFGGTYYFRLATTTGDGTVGQLDTYTVTPSLTTRTVEDSWYNTSWLNRQRITIDCSITDSDLTGFPVLIAATTTANDVHTDAQPDGDDILFTSGDGTTKIDHEIEKFDPAEKLLFAWVEVPTLYATQDTVLYMYYNNPTAVNQATSTGVWTSYEMVYHFAEDATGAVGTTYTFREGEGGYTGTADSYLNECNATTRDTNYGTSTTFEVDEADGGCSGNTNADLNGIIKWDLSTLSGCTTVNNVYITLYIDNPDTEAFDLYEVERNWTETGVTWNKYDGTNNWATAGGTGTGDIDTAKSGDTCCGATTGFHTTTLNATAVQYVQDIIDGVDNNYGWLITHNEGNETNGSIIRSRNHSTVNTRPKLTIECDGRTAEVYLDQTANNHDVASLSDQEIVTTTTGAVWRAPEFDGTASDFIVIPNSGWDFSTWTIEAWFSRGTGGVTATCGNGCTTDIYPIITKGRGESDGAGADTQWQLGTSDADDKPAISFEDSTGAGYTDKYGDSGTTYTFQDGVDGYSGTKDLTIKSGGPTTNYDSDTVIKADNTGCDGGICSGLMYFDISSIGSCTTVSSASVTVNITNATADRYGVYGLRRNWGETTATWETYDGTNSWTTAGARDTTNDRYSTDLMNGNANDGWGSGTTGVKTYDFDADGIQWLQDIIDGNITNYGFIVDENDAADDDSVQWSTRADATISNRPKLSITCDAPAGSSDNVWYYTAGVMNEAGDALTAWLNDQDGPTTVTASPSVNQNNPLCIAAACNSSGSAGISGSWDGLIDEVRISAVARSDDWIKATYRSIAGGGTYYTFFSEETAPSGGVLSVIASSTMAFPDVSYSFQAQSSTIAAAESVKVSGGGGTWTLNVSCQDNTANCQWYGQVESDRFQMHVGIADGATRSQSGILCFDWSNLSCTAETGSCTDVTLSTGYKCFDINKTDIQMASGSSATGDYWFAESSWIQGIPAGVSSGLYTSTITFDLQ